MLFHISSRIAKRQLLSQSGTPSLISNARNSTRQCRPHFPSPLTRGCGASLQPIRQYSAATTDLTESQKRKNPRSPAVQRSLRRVAVEAQRSSGDASRGQKPSGATHGLKSVTAICVAEEFAMDSVVRILRSQGYPIDPQGTGFLDDQVVHTKAVGGGDVFIFPSGTIVSWSLPEDLAIKLATQTLAPAATNPHLDQIEMEDLEYQEDPSQESSSIKGEVITLGTKMEAVENDTSSGKTSTTLAQIAFSSGLARSTKLAVLETSLTKYLDSTRTIPPILSRGGRLPFNQQFILQKTGALLELRAQLNHYSELTDSLPDLFWDSRHELGLEGYYDQVGRALDVSVRIKSLNAKMDYAHEIVSVLRETLSKSHSTWLEWIIIVLIAVEVGFELKREWKERMKAKAEAKALQKE
ncbi:hypothetical protein V494_07185 [Pseudogymnoascus sp. VKM F-4513 (FW-928)]|nr:hypothetical protein V494_07185 [Pseudogymnoascus sp. VKM F-4513 (FW-928)]